MLFKKTTCALILIGSAFTLSARAADYPERPIRILVGFAPGGTTDLVARIVGTGLSEQWGQPVVVENKAGANGALAAQTVIGSPADGYTLMVAPTGQMTVDPVVRKPAKFETLRAFTPIAVGGTFPFFVVTGRSQPFDTIPELISYGKDPGKSVSYASAGVGSLNHLAGEYFKARTGLQATHVPYKGDAPSIADLVAGTVSFNILSSTAAIPLMRSDRLKPLAVTSPQRNPLFPDVKTMAEQGVSDFELVPWIGVFGPADMPPALVRQLNEGIRKALSTDAARKLLAASSLSPDPSTPAEFTALIRKESQRWRELSQRLGITLTE